MPDILPFIEPIQDADIIDGFSKIRENFTRALVSHSDDLEKCHQDICVREEHPDDREEYPFQEAAMTQALCAHNFAVLFQAIPAPALIFSRRRKREAEQNNPMQIEPNLGGGKAEISNNNRYFG